MALPTGELLAQGNGEPKSARARRREKSKINKKKLKEQEEFITRKLEDEIAVESKKVEDIEYIAPDDLEVADNHPDIGEFKRIFGAYATPEELSAERKRVEDDEDDDEQPRERKRAPVDEELAGIVERVPEPKNHLSKRAQKAASRLSIAELKQLVAKPDVVEYHDANSHDPKLLVHLKSYRNTVPVPNHWSSKRKYLQNKRGYEKPPFQLPAFISETGITDIRKAQQDREEAKKAKTKMREKMQPKTNKVDIDYQVLRDAFFRYQKKPDMSFFGNLYYEGRELEVKLKAKRPGDLSDELKRALGMTDITSPPPWLFGMQRFGPPPAYPRLKIPGVNCPIPAGARYGFGPGEWGKPPVDEYGRPLYGDVFGTTAAGEMENANVDKTLWAVMQNDEVPEPDEDHEDDNEDEDDDMESGMESAASSVTSSGVETPETLQLRKEAEDTTTEGSSDKPKTLYTVLEEKKTAVGSSLFGSQHTYVVPPTTVQSESEKRVAAAKTKASGAVNVSLNPEDLENLDAVTLKRKYEAQLEVENVSKKVVRDDKEDDDEARQLKKPKGPTAAAKDKKKQQKYKF